MSCQSGDFLPVLLKRLVSSKQWQSRQRNDIFTREAAVQGLKSRAAFKLLQVVNYACLFTISADAKLID